MRKFQVLPGFMFRMLVSFCATLTLLGVFSFSAFAAEEEESSQELSVQPIESSIDVVGEVYQFVGGSKYEFNVNGSNATSDNYDTYGSFSISGNFLEQGVKGSVPSYEVPEGNLTFFYNYDDTKLNADLDSWHLNEDMTKEIGGFTLDSEIKKGAIIVQTSKDQQNWVDVSVVTNAFNDVPVRTDPIYTTTDIQLINGCFYRIIVAYELRHRTADTNILFVDTDEFEYRKYAEVYEFYAYRDTDEESANNSGSTYKLGSKIRVEGSEGYSGNITIAENDDHYGWDLGQFFVSGYTADTKNADGEMVFLKNVGDKVTLWFRLDQDINRLNNKDNLYVAAHTDGHDRYFETPKMNFGRGVLIIRYTDHDNVSSSPIIYTNFLEADTQLGADTKVQLFEEGDYEVALDYQVTKNEFMNPTGHYRIFFKFSIRNSNCKVFAFDSDTHEELENGDTTASGFDLDLAKSRYLDINVKYEIPSGNTGDAAWSTKWSRSAADGNKYDEEGRYTITAKNALTGDETSMIIYVGEDMNPEMATSETTPSLLPPTARS